MEIIKPKSLDLREWWKQIWINDIEKIINNKDMWKYRWFSKDKKWVNTIENWKINHYNTEETEIIFSESPEKIEDTKQKTKSEVLTDLFLSPANKVKDNADAYRQARYSDQTTFWFVSKWANKSIIVLDFSGWNKPKRIVYPLNKYNIKMKPVDI